MNRLAHPAILARIDIERDDGGRIFLHILAAAHAELVRDLITERDINEPEAFVITEDGPAVRRVGRVGLTGRNRLGLLRVPGIPVPDERTAVHIESADHAGLFLRGVIVIHRAADDDLARSNHGRRCRIIIAGGIIFHALLEMQHTLIGKGGANLAGGGIERDQPCIRRGQIDPLGAGRSRRGTRFGIIGHAAARLVLAIRIEADIRIVFPFFLACRGIDGDGPIMRRADEKRIADLERRHLIGGFAHIVRQLHVAGLVTPRFLQLRNIVDIDLGQWGITLPIGRAAILMPVTVRHIAAIGGRRGCRFLRQGPWLIMRVLCHRISGNRDGSENGKRQRPGIRPIAQPRRACKTEWLPHPGHQEPEAYHNDKTAARAKLPPVKTDFPDGPRKCCDNEDGIDVKCCAIALEEQNGRQQKGQSGKHIIKTAPKHHKLGAETEQREADEREKNCSDGDCHE